MKFKHKILLVLGLALAFPVVLYFLYPRGLSLILGYKKSCKVLRVEPFMKNVIMQGTGQTNKFAIACDDGFICRSNDTGFAGIKTGDFVEFRGYPEFSSIEEFMKCDNAQLLRLIPQNSEPQK